jgi:hypothetical protein
MSYCVYTATGEYKCNTIEHMSKVTTKKMQQIQTIQTPKIPNINNNFDNFNICKSFFTDNNNQFVQTLYNLGKPLSLPTILKDSGKNFKNCSKGYSSEKINKDLNDSKNNCYMIDPTSTIVPHGDNVSNIINKNNYKNKFDKDLFNNKHSICNIGNNKYVLCKNKNIINKIITGVNLKKEYCFKSITDVI